MGLAAVGVGVLEQQAALEVVVVLVFIPGLAV
jgi:hypothetical protein